MRESIIFWGASGQAKVLYEFIDNDNYELIALFDSNREISSPFPNVPLYYGKDGFEDWYSKQNVKISCIVAIGGDKGKDRVNIQDYLKSKGLKPIIAIHDTAYIAKSATIEEGSQVLARSVVCVDTKIGRGCIVNTCASVDHECIIGEGVHICPGANIAGCVEIEKYVTIGTGAVILPRLRIGEGAIVGAGAVVTKNVLPNTVVVGNPAKIIRRKSDE